MPWFSDLLAAPLLKDLSPNCPSLLLLDKEFCSVRRHLVLHFPRLLVYTRSFQLL